MFENRQSWHFYIQLTCNVHERKVVRLPPRSQPVSRVHWRGQRGGGGEHGGLPFALQGLAHLTEGWKIRIIGNIRSLPSYTFEEKSDLESRLLGGNRCKYIDLT